MGEFIPRPVDAVPDSKGAGIDAGRILQATALAAQLGKTVDEVLAFMGAPSVPIVQPQSSVQVKVNPVTKSTPLPMSDYQEEVFVEEPKPIEKKKASKPVEPKDNFIVMEEVQPEDLSESDLNKLSQDEEEQEQNWDGKIRVGSKVKIISNVSASRIKWVGKIGTVVREVGNEHAKIYEVQFKGRKVPKIRLNKKTGKLEKGYELKNLCNTFSSEDVELAD